MTSRKPVTIARVDNPAIAELASPEGPESPAFDSVEPGESSV